MYCIRRMVILWVVFQFLTKQSAQSVKGAKSSSRPYSWIENWHFTRTWIRITVLTRARALAVAALSTTISHKLRLGEWTFGKQTYILKDVLVLKTFRAYFLTYQIIKLFLLHRYSTIFNDYTLIKLRMFCKNHENSEPLSRLDLWTFKQCSMIYNYCNEDPVLNCNIKIVWCIHTELFISGEG